MTNQDKSVWVELPFELVERIGFFMQQPDNDGDWYDLHVACRAALLQIPTPRHQE